MPTTDTEQQRPSQPHTERSDVPQVPVSQMDKAARMRFAMKVAERVSERDREILARLAR